MTPLPPACVAVVAELLPWFTHPSRVDALARAVLDAFVAGPVTGNGDGPWYVCGISVPGVILPDSGAMWWDVEKPGDSTATRYRFESKAQARAVAAVLNYLEAKGE